MGVEFIELCLKNLASLAALTRLYLLRQRPPRAYVLEKFFYHVVLVVLEAERPGLDGIQQRGSSDQPLEDLERLGVRRGASRYACRTARLRKVQRSPPRRRWQAPVRLLSPSWRRARCAE